MFSNQRFATLWYHFIRSAVTLACRFYSCFDDITETFPPFAWVEICVSHTIFFFGAMIFVSLFFSLYVYFIIRPIHIDTHTHTYWEIRRLFMNFGFDCAHVTEIVYFVSYSWIHRVSDAWKWQMVSVLFQKKKWIYTNTNAHKHKYENIKYMNNVVYQIDFGSIQKRYNGLKEKDTCTAHIEIEFVFKWNIRTNTSAHNSHIFTLTNVYDIDTILF